MRVHLMLNPHRKDAVQAAEQTGAWLKKGGHDVATDSESGRHISLPAVSDEEFAVADLVVAFGGDGTLIRAAHLCSERGTPILGVYYGRFGFVTQCLGNEVRPCIQSFFRGDCPVESRMMVQAGLTRSHHAIADVHALNEIVLQRDASSPMMTFCVEIDGRQLTQYPADGVLVATPTGSTAYNLSAGGPIMDPRVEALAVTAIAPHTLTARTLIIAPHSEVKLAVKSSGDAVLSADGQARLHLLPGDEVTIRKSPRVTNLVSVERDDFLIKLSQRLQWSQSMLGEHE